MTKEELVQMKVRDVIRMPEFREELERQLQMEQDDHTKAVLRAASSGRRLKRTPLDGLRDRGVFDAEHLVVYFEHILDKSLVGFGASEREYIRGLGMIVFGRLMKRMQKDAE